MSFCGTENHTITVNGSRLKTIVFVQSISRDAMPLTQREPDEDLKGADQGPDKYGGEEEYGEGPHQSRPSSPHVLSDLTLRHDEQASAVNHDQHGEEDEVLTDESSLPPQAWREL